MPRTDVPVTTMVAGTGTVVPAGTSVTAANDGNILAASDTQKLLIMVANASGGSANMVVKAGAGIGAFQSTLGDLTVAIADSTERGFIIESARFAQANGSINFDPSATVTVTAIKLP